MAVFYFLKGCMDKLQAANRWLDMGVRVLPCQPRTKALVTGFGLYQRQITTKQEAARWFSTGWANLAVVAGPLSNNLLALDFDNLAIYQQWRDSVTEIERSTYHEQTRRGFHLYFFIDEQLPRLAVLPGVEIKSVMVCAPSVVGDWVYRSNDPGAEVKFVDDWRYLLSSLIVKELPAPVRLSREYKPAVSTNDLIGKVKRSWPLDLYISVYLPSVRLKGRGDFLSALCPLHKETEPSFWINPTKGIWGCHSCHKRGDVINLHAEINKITLVEAMHELYQVPGKTNL